LVIDLFQKEKLKIKRNSVVFASGRNFN
jgi:hypothetical protein